MNYIFFTIDICKMGGLQLYLKTKSEWLEARGYHVIIFTPNVLDDKCQIKGLQKYLRYSLFPLAYLPYKVPKLLLKKTKKEILRYIDEMGDDEETIIESHYAMGACWGEYIAEEIKAKNFVYMLSERYEEVEYYEIEKFLKWKYDRNSLAGNNNLTIRKVLHNNQIEKKPECVLVPCEGNAPVDIPCELLEDLPESDCKIGLLSRMEKGYVRYIFKAIKKFAEDNPQKKILFIAVGDVGENEWLFDIVANQSNLNVITTGNLSPIPKDFVENIDIAIAGAGSVLLLAEQEVPVIVASAENYDAIGIFGYDVWDRHYSNKSAQYNDESELVQTYVKYLQRWFDGEITSTDIKVDGLPDKDVEFERHLRFVSKIENDGKYWDLQDIDVKKKYSIKQQIWPYIYSVLGIKNGNRINTLVHKKRN